MKHYLLLSVLVFMSVGTVSAANKYDNPDTLFVAADGSCEFATIGEAVEVCRAFMDYHKVIFVKKGVYHEKLIVPSWLTNIEICGEDRDATVITNAHHANMPLADTGLPMGTFRTYTVKVEGNDITFKNITIENNAPKLGQAVTLHTEGDRLVFVNCRLLGNQDTVYTGVGGTRIYFYQCYIEGTTDFIFGPSTAWFEQCLIHSKADSYVTAASTPRGVEYGYVFNACRLTADEGVTKVYLGRPWRPYAHTLFMNCEMGGHIVPAGWHNWGNADNETTVRYQEYNNTGDGCGEPSQRAAWTTLLTQQEAAAVTPEHVFRIDSSWLP